jgi:dTDP-4-dehydrorhamnose reductase
MKLLALVVGAGGQLGEAMATQFAARHTVVSRTRDELDLADASTVHDTVAAICPDIIVNCAAYTNVDGAEGDPQQAFATNAWAVRMLAREARRVDAILVHYSTDFVFDGRADRPYVETDAPNPRSAYATSKLLGEWLATDAPRHYVLRVESLFGGPRARSSVDRILEGLRAGTDVRAFSDRTVSPSFVDDVVDATSSLIAGESPYGLYHCVNSGFATWLEVARHAAELLGKPGAPITPIKMADVRMIADRPMFAALSNEKLAGAGVEMPTWQDALRRYVDES